MINSHNQTIPRPSLSLTSTHNMGATHNASISIWGKPVRPQTTHNQRVSGMILKSGILKLDRTRLCAARGQFNLGRFAIGQDVSYQHFFFSFTHIYFPASGQAVVTGVVPSPPPVLCLQFLSCLGFSNPTARRFSSSIANSRSRAFRKSIYALEKVPTNLYEHALRGIRTHETDLYQARG